MVGSLLLRVFAVVLLVAVNAFLVAAEYALVSLRLSRIQHLVETGRASARTVLRLHQNLDSVLAAVQLGITLVALSLGWVGEPAITFLFEHWLGFTPLGHFTSHVVAIVFAFLVITYVDVILGEIVPKSLALQRGERVALAVAAPMDFFITVFRPFLKMIRVSAHAALHLFGIQHIAEGKPHSPEELKYIVTGAHQLANNDSTG